MIPFLDTSALVKRYLAEPGSQQVRALLRRKQPAVARITYAELAAVVARVWRDGRLTPEERDRILDRLDDDFARMSVVEIRRATVRRVPDLVRRHALKGYDAVQLAAALGVREESGSVEMWSADARLVEAARAEGLRGVALEG